MCILPGKAVLEMIYTESGGTLNPTHSLTHSPVQLVGEMLTAMPSERQTDRQTDPNHCCCSTVDVVVHKVSGDHVQGL